MRGGPHNKRKKPKTEEKKVKRLFRKRPFTYKPPPGANVSGDWHIKKTYRNGRDGIRRGPYYHLQRRDHQGKVQQIYVGTHKIDEYDLMIINDIYGGSNEYLPTSADLAVLVGHRRLAVQRARKAYLK